MTVTAVSVVLLNIMLCLLNLPCLTSLHVQTLCLVILNRFILPRHTYTSVVCSTVWGRHDRAEGAVQVHALFAQDGEAREGDFPDLHCACALQYY